MDELSFWTRELSAAEVAAIYRRQSRRYYLGTYVSRIIDAAEPLDWSALSWTPLAPYGKAIIGTESAYSTQNLSTSSLELLLHLDEASGGLTDNSGNARDGTPGGTLGYSSPGIHGSSLTFNGSNSILTVPADVSLEPATMTLSLWAKREATCVGYHNNQCGIADTNHGGNSGWALQTDNNVVSFAIGTGGTYDEPTSATELTLNEWHHIVGTADATAVKLYLDGRLVDSVASTGTLVGTGDTLRIGQTLNGLRWFPGQIDEVALWSRALSASEILAIYERGATDLKHQFRTCNDNACSGESFVGTDGTSQTFFF